MHLEMEPVAKGYALWLMPEEPMFSLLANTISRLSQELSTPFFEPHVTLLGGITVPEEEALAKCASLASILRRFRIELGDIGYLDEYFRCLFISVLQGDPIMKAHQAAQEAFDFQDESPYMPHVSLVYGNLRIETKKGIAASFGSLSGQALEVSHLSLYKVSGAPREWECAKRFGLR